MNSFFDINGKFYKIISTIGDLMLLNLLFVLCALPIVTAGASFAALYSMTLKIAKGWSGNIRKTFFEAFKANFKQATIIWGVCLLVFVALTANYMLGNVYGGMMETLIVFSVVLFIVWAFIFSLLFPMVAKFENTIGNIFKNSLIMAISHPLKVFAVAQLNFLPMILLLFSFRELVTAMIFYVFIGFALVAYANSFVINNVFSYFVSEE